jgi:methylglyoxal synthase
LGSTTAGSRCSDLKPRKRIGLVAHDNKKQDLIEWARYNRGMLAAHDLVATGTTGTMLQRELELPVTCSSRDRSAATCRSGR